MSSLVDAMQTLLLGAKVLSAMGLLALAAALIDLWRRGEMPSVSYGAILLSQERLKALWAAFLVGALVVGSNNDPVLVRTDDVEDPAVSETSEEPTARSSLSLPRPFYRYERERESSNNDSVLVRTDDVENPAVSETAEGPTVRSSVFLPLPFYRYERDREIVNGEVAEEHVLEGVVLPWAFIWALIAYYLLVVRWNPESRWAQRILEGKKR